MVPAFHRYWFLYPVALLYGTVIAVRNFLYNKGVLPSTEYDIPVICVGNLAVGGTGKTTHVDYLIELLKPHFRVAVLSRGYKRMSRGFRIVTALDTVAMAGDEPLQLAMKHNDIVVAVDRDRNNGIREIVRQRPDTGVIIMDDGFQHRSVTPAISIILSEYSNLYVNDCLLPCGTLREHHKNIRRANFILITKSPPDISPMDRRVMFKNLGKYPYQNLYFTTLKYGSPMPVFPDRAREMPDAGQLNDKCVVLVTGIANPAPLYDYLNNLARDVRHAGFADHHNFTLEEINSLVGSKGEGADCYLTTEKDAIRLRMIDNLPDIFVRNLYYIPVKAEFLSNDAEEFNNHIIKHVRKNKGNSGVPGEKGFRKS